MTSPVTSLPKDISRALVQLDPIAPKDNPITPSVQALATISFNSSALQAPVLNPKAMGLVILHCCLAQLPRYNPEGYTTLFPVDLIINPNNNDF